MTVYIRYTNQQKHSLFENENSFFDLKLSDVFDTDYIKEKLKELLFQKLPILKRARRNKF